MFVARHRNASIFEYMTNDLVGSAIRAIIKKELQEIRWVRHVPTTISRYEYTYITISKLAAFQFIIFKNIICLKEKSIFMFNNFDLQQQIFSNTYNTLHIEDEKFDSVLHYLLKSSCIWSIFLKRAA